jgi:hypothetical protein
LNSKRDHLLFVFSLISTTLGSLGSLSLDTSGTATAVRRGQGKVNVFLRVKTDNEGRDVDNLFSNSVFWEVYGLVWIDH